MSANNPFSIALNFQRELLDTAVGSAERGTIASEQADRIQDVEVGQTPSTVVYEENKLELLHYESRTDEQHGTPILIVYALINKPFILDLQPERSVVRRLLDAGHDVYLIDWNEPSRLDKHLTLDDYVNRYIDNCVDVVRERSGADRINLLGYCMGGTMTAIYTALHQQKVQALGLMAAGLCFDDTGGTLELWGDSEYYEPRDIVDVYGNVPADVLDIGFALMDPVANYVSKYLRLYDNLENDDFVENFARMERWLDEGIDVAGETYVQFLEDIYQDNKLYRNELYVGDKHVDVSGIDVPVCLIIGEYDHLIPAETSKPFKDVVGTDDVTILEQSTGHIGLSVSGSSHSELWPDVSEWYFDNSPSSPENSESAGSDALSTAEEAVEEAIDNEVPSHTDTTGSERDTDTGRFVDTDTTGSERDTDTGRFVDTDTGSERDADTGRFVDTDTGSERDADTGRFVDTDTGSERDADTGRFVDTDTGSERDADTGRFVDTDTGGDDDTDTEEGDITDLQSSISGIGPTYAERLRSAGIEAVEDLATTDPEEIAEIADIGVTRAANWHSQANSQ